MTVRQMIARYLEQCGGALGRTKEATLKAIGETWLGDLQDRDFTSQRLHATDHTRHRLGQWAALLQRLNEDHAQLPLSINEAIAKERRICGCGW